jgi:hypothetical protein
MMYEIDAGGLLPIAQLTVEQFTRRLIQRARITYQARQLLFLCPNMPLRASKKRDYCMTRNDLGAEGPL